MAAIPLVALEGAHQLLVAARDDTPSALGIGSHPAEIRFWSCERRVAAIRGLY